MSLTKPDLATIRLFVQQLSALTSANDVLWSAAEFIGQLGFPDCVIYKFNAERTALKQKAAFGPKSPRKGVILNPIEIPAGHGITGHVAMSRENMVISDVTQCPRYIVDLDQLQSEVTVCILTNGQVFGVIDCESPERHAFSQEHLELLEFVVELMVPKLEYLQLQSETKPSKSSLIQEKKQMRKRLNDILLQGQDGSYPHMMEKISQLTGGIAHDFNNQLGVIRNELELLCLKYPILKGETIASQAAIDRSAELIQRLLAYSSQLKLSPNSVNLANQVRKIQSLLIPNIKPNIEVHTKIDESLKNVNIDPTQIDNVMLNLALNACEAMPDGGVLTISCYNTLLDPEFLPRDISLEKGPYVVIEVSDTGIGMDASVKKRVFEPYFTTKPVGAGAGLGLSMVYGFVKQSGGDILITSVKDKGSSVKLFFKSHDVPVNTRPEVKLCGTEKSGNNQLILVLDDDVNMANSVGKYLRVKGYQPLVATTAQQAIMIASQNPGIQLIISDVILDADNYGPNVVAEIQEHVPDSDCIFMSGFVNPNKKNASQELNNHIFLVKPFSLRKLGEAVSNVLNHKDVPIRTIA